VLKLARAVDRAVMVASVVAYDFPIGDRVVGMVEAEACDTATQKAAQKELDHARELCAPYRR